MKPCWEGGGGGARRAPSVLPLYQLSRIYPPSEEPTKLTRVDRKPSLQRTVRFPGGTETTGSKAWDGLWFPEGISLELAPKSDQRRCSGFLGYSAWLHNLCLLGVPMVGID